MIVRVIEKTLAAVFLKFFERQHHFSDDSETHVEECETYCMNEFLVFMRDNGFIRILGNNAPLCIFGERCVFQEQVCQADYTVYLEHESF